MDRRYYLAKLAIVVAAIALAVAGSGMSTTRVAHSFGAHARYGAPAEVEAAAWHVTAAIGHLLAHLFSSVLQLLT